MAVQFGKIIEVLLKNNKKIINTGIFFIENDNIRKGLDTVVKDFKKGYQQGLNNGDNNDYLK